MSPAEVTEHHESLVGSSLLQEIRWTIAAWPTDWKMPSPGSVLYSASYMFVATFVPAIAFGGYLQTATADHMGLTEVLLAQTVPSLLYALMGGNPLAVLRVSGPVVAFVGIAAKTAESVGHDLLPLWSLTTLWMAFFLLIAAVAHWSRFITKVTDFTEEVFSALVSIIFITTAIEFVASYFSPSADPYQDTIAIFTLLLFLLSYVISTFGNSFRTSRFLSSRFRNGAFVLSGVVAIAIPVALSALTRGRFHDTDTLAPLAHLDTNPEGGLLRPTLVRDWFIPLGPTLHNDPAILLTSAILGLCLALLFYLEQNVSILLMNTPDHHLTRPPSFHADLALTALLGAACGSMGLPVSHIALPHSVLHVVASAQSFEDIVDGQVRRTTLSVSESRWSALLTALFMLVGTLLAPFFNVIPLAALYGAFLYLGLSSLSSNALLARLSLPFISTYPANSVAHLLPLSHISAYSMIQLCWLGAIFAVKKGGTISPLFPLLVFAMVPFRFKILPKFFKEFELNLLEHSHESLQDDRRHRRRI
jgi:solute carrier family 4 anion exchanger 2/solute carrier family 4 anion exchanger 3